MKPIEILLVEDNPADVRLTKEAFQNSKITNELRVAVDGAAAIAYLELCGHGTDRALPDLILLDLNLPKLNGHEVLKRIKEHEVWKLIPVVVLTTSSAQKDIQDCYAQHVNCFITKPLGYDAFLEVVEQIEDFWLTLVRLPHK